MSCKLELSGITFRRGENTILDSVSLTVPPGGVVVLGGRSGCGKSTFLEICAGLLKPSSGYVAWDGAEVTGMSRYELYARRKSLGYVFQVHALIANHSVFDNIALPLRCGGMDLSGEQVRKRVWAQMEELGIGRDIEKKFPETLSAAQLRSVALARALVSDPRLLILDEPLSGVDPFTSSTIISVLHRRWAKSGMTVIMAAHSISAWPEWGAGRYQLKNGRLESADEAFSAPVRDLKYNQKFTYAK